MTNPSTRDQIIARFGLQPLPGATQVTDAQIDRAFLAQERAAPRQAEQARTEAGLARWHRIRAVNDTVAAYSHVNRHHHHGEQPAQRQGADDAEGNKAPEAKELQYKLTYRVTPGAFGQAVKTSECPAAVTQEVVAQFA